ncbi:MAG: histidinol-phosphate transaminase [Treponema sp.]|nr:histidinol-phosphate transaminase [Treponema sp.]
MSVYWNVRAKNLSPYVPGEQPKDRQFIKLNTNENPYPPSPKVIEAVKEAAGDRLRLYPDPECTEFREAVSKRYGVKIDQVFAGNGSDEILAFAFGAFFEKTILFPDISYSFYPVYADLWDIPYCPVSLKNDFTIKASDYKVPSDGAVFPNPNAPTGIAMPLGDVLSIAEFMEKQKKVLIVDEAYNAFGAQSVVPHINKYKNILAVHTLSKSASLAGLRTGFAIGSEELIEGLKRIRDSFNSYTLDRLALSGAAAAINDSRYYDEINKKVISTRERTAEILRGIGFNVLPSSANFLFISFPKIDGTEIYSKLREKGILVRHFKKERIKDYLRVTIGTDEDMDKFIKECKVITENH